MRPILIIIGLVVGALLGGYFATTYGAEYLSQQSYDSPDEQSALYQMMFLGGAALFALVGAIIGLAISFLTGSDD